MIDKLLLAGLESVTQQALALHRAEQAAGGAEDETKWAELEGMADLYMKAIDKQVADKETQFEQLEKALDDAMATDDEEQVQSIIAKMFYTLV
jgi:hypothetical protein